MLGLMEDRPLLCHRIIDHAAVNHGERPVISRSIEGPFHHTNYAEVRARALRVAQRLERDGIQLGDRVGDACLEHLAAPESWYGIFGIGAIYHTVNPRLFPEQIVWIVNHAEDRVMMTDRTFLPLLEKIADKMPSIERTIVFTDAAHMPATSLRNAVPYEEWLAEADGDFRLEVVRREHRRGHVLHLRHHRQSQGRALFRHRSNVLHTLMSLQSEVIGITSAMLTLPIVPMFHANSWALAFSSPTSGSARAATGRRS